MNYDSIRYGFDQSVGMEKRDWQSPAKSTESILSVALVEVPK